jgi:pSer/pThr/pTyr-binding forkhead associated (FHA) protein
MTINARIGLFEKLARQLVEGAFERPFGQRKLVREIARRIAYDVEQSALASDLANNYSIQLHPDTYNDLLEASPSIKAYLDEYLSDIAREYDLISADEAGIRIISNKEIERNHVLVRADHGSSLREITMRGFHQSGKQVQSAIEKTDAFLILDGRRHIKLRQPIITIGRHLENDIVLEDSSISRQHVQLRWQYDRFILLDLGSKAGTLVNNRLVNQHLLKNGDVIRLGHSALIYGEEFSIDEEGSSLPDQVDGSTRQLPRRNLE